MNWIIRLGKDCTPEDYAEMLKSHKFNGIDSLKQFFKALDQFSKKSPSVPIDQVAVVINKDASMRMFINGIEFNEAESVTEGEDA